MAVKQNGIWQWRLAAGGMLAVLLLSGCGSTDSALGGGAGLNEGEPTEFPAAGEATAEPAPTSTPIPQAYGHIIFVSNRDGQMDLYLATPDGFEQTRLTMEASDDIAPRVSPDGRRVAFVSTVNGNMDIYILDLDTRAVTRVTDAEQKDTSPSWSPDGNRLAFESFRDGNFEIYMANVDGSNPIRLTDDPAGDGDPVWSPAGDEIAFVSDRFGNSDIFLITPGRRSRHAHHQPRAGFRAELVAGRQRAGL